jgi:hypothetical protein
MEKGKRKKGFSLLAGSGGGGISAQPSARARARADGLAGPPAGDRAGMAPWAQVHVPARGEGTALGGDGGGGEPAGVRPSVRLHGGSPSRSRFCVDGVVARHGRR